MASKCVADIEGPWADPEFDSSLVERCGKYWNVPVVDLPNAILAMFIRQRFGLSAVVPEARNRIAAGAEDGSELYDEELSEALNEIRDA